MVDELATVGGGKPFLDFLHEPFVVVDHAFDGLHYERLAVAALLGRQAGELCLHFRLQAHFHGSSLGIAGNRVNPVLKQASRMQKGRNAKLEIRRKAKIKFTRLRTSRGWGRGEAEGDEEETGVCGIIREALSEAS
jgi:hypothetical protein